jgi:Sec-independent protein translocase protein TatA
MESVMKQWFVMVPLIALVAACSEKSSENMESGDVGRPQVTRQEILPEEPSAVSAASDAASAAAGPAINITAAPGVAFNYRYAYRLPNAKISAVQEEHAQMCEKLGISRCKITGLRYRLLDNEDISAALELKLDPTLARQFGKDAATVVGKAEGMVVDTDISGVDVGGTINAAGRSIAQMRDELAKIEAQLKGKLNEEARYDLQARASELREQINGTKAQKADAEESLATTPMVFNYGSGSVIPGFDGASPVSEGFKAGINSFMTMIGVILLISLSALPWLALVAVLMWLWRRYQPGQWFRKRASSPTEGEATTG